MQKILTNLLGILLLCMTPLVHAGTPVWTFTPLTATSIIIPNNSTATVQYQVTNQSTKSHTLFMKSIQGVTQITTGTGICANPFTLSSKSSCTLSLQIDGSQVPNGSTGGPVVCQESASLECYRPSPPDILTITRTNNDQYSVGGSVSALTGTVVLQNNGTDTLSISANGSFTFPTTVVDGEPYDVTVLTQPAGQICVVTNGSGTISGANVTNVLVTCSDAFTVGGTISGLSGTVVLQNNGTDTLSRSVNGAFTFPTTIANGNIYDVTVLTQPAGQTCSIVNGSGTINTANVTNVLVTCSASTFTIGGTLSGLSGTIVLQNNRMDDITRTTNGAFTFSTALANGTTYNVSVAFQPTTQTCSVGNGSGTVSGANVTNVTVTCVARTYTVGGAISGLTGTVVLRNNGGNSLTRTVNGSFTFSAALANGASYNVTVFTQPAGQTCSVINATGTINAGNIRNVSVVCSATTFTVGGTISGLTGTVVLQNNGGNNLSRSVNGAFTFSTALANGSAYNVTVLTQPAGQTCSVTNGSGTVSGANVTSVSVICSATTYTIGGTVSGLSGTVILNNNNTNGLSVTTNGPFTFPTALADGTPYNVTVSAQPTNQTCIVTNGTGTVSGANVTNVLVTCSAITSNQWIYVANFGSSTVSQCSIDSTSGILFNCAATAGSGFNATDAIAIDRSTNFAYVTNFDGNSVVQCTVDSTTGVLSACAPSGATLINQPTGVALNNGYAYILNFGNNDNSSLIKCTITPVTGTLSSCAPTAIGSGNSNPLGGIAFYNNSLYMTPQGTTGGVIQCRTINASTGAVSNCSSTGTIFPDSTGVTLGNGFAYTANFGNGTTTGNTVTKCTVNATTGALSSCIPITGPFSGPDGVGLSNGYLYVLNVTSNSVAQCTVNPSTGALSNCIINGSTFSQPSGEIGFLQ